jgi:hypothetical protein
MNNGAPIISSAVKPINGRGGAFDHDEAITAGIRLPSFYRFLIGELGS